MTTKEIIELLLGSGGLLGILFIVFRMGRTVQCITTMGNTIIEFKSENNEKFKQFRIDVDERFESFNRHLEKHFNEMKTDNKKSITEMKADNERILCDIRSDIKEIKHSINSMEVQIGKLETRVEERTLRVVNGEYDRNGALR